MPRIPRRFLVNRERTVLSTLVNKAGHHGTTSYPIELALLATNQLELRVPLVIPRPAHESYGPRRKKEV